MKLYYSPGACSLAVHIALREVGAEFHPVPVDLSRHELPDGSDYTAISPRGYVPMLALADGSLHTEVASLLQYVADLDGTHALIGAPGSARRLAVVEWIAFVSSELHKVFSPWMWHMDTADSTRVAASHLLARRFAELDEHLAGNDWLADAFSVADAYAFTIVNWARIAGMPLTAYPHLRAYLERVAARGPVREALAAEGLVQ